MARGQTRGIMLADGVYYDTRTYLLIVDTTELDLPPSEMIGCADQVEEAYRAIRYIQAGHPRLRIDSITIMGLTEG
jgi:hypothetical protein